MEIKLHGKPNCSFCDLAKNMLTKKGIDFQYLSIGTDLTIEEAKAIAGSDSPMLPIVVIDDVYIGGQKELHRFLRNNV